VEEGGNCEETTGFPRSGDLGGGGQKVGREKNASIMEELAIRWIDLEREAAKEKDLYRGRKGERSLKKREKRVKI